MNNQFGVHSEVGKLRKVIVHRPDLSLKRLTPTNHDDHLFDDVLTAVDEAVIDLQLAAPAVVARGRWTKPHDPAGAGGEFGDGDLCSLGAVGNRECRAAERAAGRPLPG